MKLVMAGAAGRMGKTILGLAAQDKKIKIVGGLEHASSPFVGKDVGDLLGKGNMKAPIVSDPRKVLDKADAVIDFTHSTVVSKVLKVTLASKVAYVIGTTGLSASVEKAVKAASKKIPIVQSPNMSVGVNLLFYLTELAGTVLDETYDVEISEIHHRGKKDAPSGTAMKLLERVAAVRKKNMGRDTIYGRRGDIGVRPQGKIGTLALRGGDVVGDHTVFFLGDGERVELTHRASSREAFAKGALLAAKFASKKKKGLYDMRQVLGMA